MGILSDWLDEKKRERQAQALPGILGTSPQRAVVAEGFGQGNTFSDRLYTPLQSAQEGTGFRGSDMGRSAQTDLLADLMTKGGMNERQAISLLSTELGPQMEQQKPTGLMQNLTAAGVDFNSPEGKKTLLDAVMKPQTQITQNLGGGTGSIWNPKQVKQAGFAPGTVITEDRYGKPQVLNKEKYTQPQILSGTYAARMDDATNSIKKIMETDFDPAGIMQNIDFFGSPDIIANYMRSPEGQQYRQAQENWISANLRKESGAAIPEQEMDREIKKWFPYPGDKAQNIAQKSQARKTAERGMRKAAGGSYQELIDQGEADRLEELRAKHGVK